VGVAVVKVMTYTGERDGADVARNGACVLGERVRGTAVLGDAVAGEFVAKTGGGVLGESVAG